MRFGISADNRNMSEMENFHMDRIEALKRKIVILETDNKRMQKLLDKNQVSDQNVIEAEYVR